MILALIGALRIYMMVGVGHIRDAFRSLKDISHGVWAALLVCQSLMWVLFYALEIKNQQMKSFLILDTLMFVMQLCYYYYQVYYEYKV